MLRSSFASWKDLVRARERWQLQVPLFSRVSGIPPSLRAHFLTGTAARAFCLQRCRLRFVRDCRAVSRYSAVLTSELRLGSEYLGVRAGSTLLPGHVANGNPQRHTVHWTLLALAALDG